MTILTRDQLLAGPPGRRTTKVKLSDKWGPDAEILIAEPSALDMSALWPLIMRGRDLSEHDRVTYFVRILERCAVDEHGRRLFKDGELDENAWPLNDLVAVHNAYADLSHPEDDQTLDPSAEGNGLDGTAVDASPAA